MRIAFDLIFTLDFAANPAEGAFPHNRADRRREHKRG